MAIFCCMFFVLFLVQKLAYRSMRKFKVFYRAVEKSWNLLQKYSNKWKYSAWKNLNLAKQIQSHNKLTSGGPLCRLTGSRWAIILHVTLNLSSNAVGLDSGVQAAFKIIFSLLSSKSFLQQFLKLKFLKNNSSKLK